ncbi:MAG: response regulator transcription factor [Caldilineaceae bacterium]
MKWWVSRNGREAIAQAETLAPDVVPMDINMPDVNGIEATQQLLAVKPETGIVMLTMLEDNGLALCGHVCRCAATF